jgi:hypothetical protein
MYLGLHESIRYYCQILTKLKYQISRKSFQWQPSCSIRMDTLTDMTKPKGAFRNFANATGRSCNGAGTKQKLRVLINSMHESC